MSTYGAMEESPPAAAPALAPAEIKAVRKLLSATSATNGGSDVTDQPGLLHEPQELSTSALAKLEAASDEVEFQRSIWDASLFLFNPVAGRGGNALVDVSRFLPFLQRNKPRQHVLRAVGRVGRPIRR